MIVIDITDKRKKWFLKAFNRRKCPVCKNPFQYPFQKTSIRINGVGVVSTHKKCLEEIQHIKVIGSED